MPRRSTGLGEDDGWEIKRAEACRLTAEQRQLMAFAAPLLVYNDEAVDAVKAKFFPRPTARNCRAGGTSRTATRRSGSCSGCSTKGHHADADAALALMRGGQPDAGDPEEKAEDVQSIAGVYGRKRVLHS